MKLFTTLPGRQFSGSLLLVAMLAMLAIDLFQTEPINPYQAPYPTALGSGQAPSGAHCTDLSVAE